MTKLVVKTQQNLYDRINKNNTTPQELISNRENEIEEEPKHKIKYIDKYGRELKKYQKS